MKNKLTTIAGFLSGASLIASAFWKEYGPILQAIGGVLIMILGRFAKDVPKTEE